MELVAHRAGNQPSSLPGVLSLADTVELDVHLFRGRLEVRHAKVLWPFATRWEQWEFLPAMAPRHSLGEILDAIPDRAHLWLDLKGYTSRLTTRALDAVGERHQLTVSSRCWWILGPARRSPEVRVMRSVGNALQLWAAKLLRGRHPAGVVMHERFALGASVARLSRSSFPVFVWGVTDVERVQALAELGIHGVIVDDPELIAAARQVCSPAFTPSVA